MKISVKGVAENILFALNIFIVFLLIYGDRISVPYWLEPLGRLHPMLLHFPIVLLLLAMLLEFFRFKEAYTAERLYQNFTTGLLLTGVFLSAVTVIMGLFLSKEEGYSGSTLQWHKWTGVGIVFISSIIYWCRNFNWYKAPLAKIGAVLTTLCLIAAGHYGATLTHGDNFVLASLASSKQQKKVPVTQAILFDDVIMPIFSEKCMSCHNLDKAKGSLILSDASSVFKGGKTGKLFVPGKPEISLLLERIHLPVDDKKHMPPKSKAQLTDEEVAILTLWIKHNAGLKQKVVELPANDSLRILATASLGPLETAERHYDFAGADEKVIEKLNNDYRVVYTIAKGSPALAVNIYNKNIYKPEALKELTAIKKQMVSLNLNHLPVKDEELKLIGAFENLDQLNLNFTAINGDGLKYLNSLKQLNLLSLSGTKVNYSAVQQVLSIKSLKKLVLWNTAVTEAELAQLQKLSKNMVVIGGYKDDGKSPAKLNQPRLNTDVAIFKNQLSLQIKHPIHGVQIRYTLDGSEPDSISSAVYHKEISIKETTVLKAKAYKNGWYGSDPLVFNFYKSSYKPESVKLLIAPDPAHKAIDPKTLFDDQLGDYDLNSGKWNGFREHGMEVLMVFKTPVLLRSVVLNTMRQARNYILPPQQVEIWGSGPDQQMRLLGLVKSKIPKIEVDNAFIQIEAKFKAQSISRLKIVAKNLIPLPEGYPAKGGWPLIAVDEIFLN